MSLLIKGMEMPKNGQITIELASEETGTNILALITDDKTGKLIGHEGVVAFPTLHGALIDRDDLLEYFGRKSKGKTAEEALKLLYTTLKAYPTVIEKEEK